MTLSKKLSLKIQKVFKYEYWHYLIFYTPMFFYGAYLALKARSIMYFSAVNSAFKYGGVMGDSKSKALEMIPEKYLPDMMVIDLEAEEWKNEISELPLKYPMIAKPDIGERGTNVEKIDDQKGLYNYMYRMQCGKVILQEYIDLPLELGVLYYRFPDQKSGNISSVVQKSFLKVTGDNVKTVEELLAGNIRAYDKIEYFRKKYGESLKKIPASGEELVMEPIGNHCRGTKFINGNHLINENLIEVFDEITKNMTGYCYGRFDIKVKSLKNLYEGNGIKVLELNGVSSEPAHIYDPDMNLIQAYKDVAQHMKIIYEISQANHKKGISYSRSWPFIKDLYCHIRQ
ncbi:MAG TPA: hypothetical protein DDY13_18380 [Cytophagales bacterium]|jgi:hypothetical protein|nr:hypothetical protein [Cytophagales bacterium]